VLDTKTHAYASIKERVVGGKDGSIEAGFQISEGREWVERVGKVMQWRAFVLEFLERHSTQDSIITASFHQLDVIVCRGPFYCQSATVLGIDWCCENAPFEIWKLLIHSLQADFETVDGAGWVRGLENEECTGIHPGHELVQCGQEHGCCRHDATEVEESAEVLSRATKIYSLKILLHKLQ
jgi:hypothetical protein